MTQQTVSPEIVERVARAIADHVADDNGDESWFDTLAPEEQEHFHRIARAALASIPADPQVEELKQSVIAFAGPWAAQYTEEHGLPKGHLHPQHYDLLAKCGARMDDFTRAALNQSTKEGSQ